jgi:hypothetical protein
MGACSRLHNETYRQICKHFPDFKIKENVRPEWLRDSNLSRLELDIYLEEIKMAIEIQGIQHYQFTPYFHKTYQDFRDQRQRDREKRALCEGHGIKLIEIACYTDLNIFIKEFKEDLQEPKFHYADPGKHKHTGGKRYGNSVMRSKRWRSWLKKKKLQAAGLWVPKEITPRIKLLGTNKQRGYARKLLNCERLDENIWRVWGGENEHIVKNGSCDCWHNVNTGKICTHLIKISWEIDNANTRI